MATTKTSATSTNCAEIGFIIYLKTTANGFQYDCSTVFTNTTNYDVRPWVTLSGYTDDPPVSGSSPLVGGKYYVADFHTHPPLSKMPVAQGMTVSRKVGPSKPEPNDLRFDAPGPNGIPSFVYDYVGDADSLHRSTDAISVAAKIYEYGGTQRNNNY